MEPLLLNLPNKIETQRLILRPFLHADSDAFYAGFCESFDELTTYFSAEWCQLQSLPPPETMAVYLRQAIVKWHERSKFHFAVFEKNGGTFVGEGRVHHVDWTVPKARCGYWIRTDKKGNGYATDVANALTCFCFDFLKLARLEIRADIRNSSSGKIARKLGYEFLTVFKKNVRGRNGDLWDVEIYVRFDKQGLPDISVTYS